MKPALFSPAILFILCLLSDLGVQGHPILSGWLRKVSATGSENGWLWGWAWGSDSTVTIVDRSPPVMFASRPASFGVVLEDPLMGYVIPLSSFTVPCNDSDGIFFEKSKSNLGCPNLCVSSPHEPERTESWIALVQRGKCQFVDKVREAQRFGAKGVVVGGNNPDESGNPDALVGMYSPGIQSPLTLLT